jgi:hypothetical protein
MLALGRLRKSRCQVRHHLLDVAQRAVHASQQIFAAHTAHVGTHSVIDCRSSIVAADAWRCVHGDRSKSHSRRTHVLFPHLPVEATTARACFLRHGEHGGIQGVCFTKKSRLSRKTNFLGLGLLFGQDTYTLSKRLRSAFLHSHVFFRICCCCCCWHASWSSRTEGPGNLRSCAQCVGTQAVAGDGCCV